jgi:thiol reductant ABC exporter CydC subunit
MTSDSVALVPPQPSAWRSLLHIAVLCHAERRRLWASIALGFGAVTAAAGLLTTSGYLISRAAQRPDILTLTAAIVGVRAFGIARACLRYGERLVSHDLAFRVLGRLRSSFYQVLAPLVPGSLRGHSGGELLSRFVGDVDTLQDLYLRALAPPVVAAIVIAAASLVAVLMLPVAGVAVGAGLLATAVAVPLVTAALAASAGRRQAPARARLTAELVEAIDGGSELAVAGRGPDRCARLADADRALHRIAVRDALAGTVATTMGSVLSGATILAVLLVAIPAVHAGTLSGVLLAALVFLVLGAYEGINPLPAAARRLRACAEAAGRLEALGRLIPAVQDPVRPRPASGDPDAVLAVEHVSFHHRGETTSPLREVDLRLEPGCRVALTGPSGIGKTTLAQLLVRFADPVAGSVTLGGIDLRELSQDDVRHAVVLAAQDAHVFTTTIRENLSLANRAAGEPDIWRVLAAVALTDWVHTLPLGLDTLVGEDGELVSGGQRQRIAVARALLADARYLIFDEPTAQLDADTAAAVIEGIDAVAGDRGVLLITHRTERRERFDRVLSLRAGRLHISER